MSAIIETEVSKKNFGEALSPETAVSFDPLIGQVFEARYKIVQRLGEGAMGIVYEVEHTNLKKRFAMKVTQTVSLSQTSVAQLTESFFSLWNIWMANLCQI